MPEGRGGRSRLPRGGTGSGTLPAVQPAPSDPHRRLQTRPAIPSPGSATGGREGALQTSAAARDMGYAFGFVGHPRPPGLHTGLHEWQGL